MHITTEDANDILVRVCLGFLRVFSRRRNKNPGNLRLSGHCSRPRVPCDRKPRAARHAGTPIQVHAPPRLPGTWDRLAMEQIIDNLVSNAIKYGARPPIEVWAEDHGNHVSLRVRDHGPGISLEDRSRIFERFERAVGLDKRRSGFGVGLWVVGQLVAAMGGTIMVADAPGGGAEFTVTLPCHVEAVRP
jgi:signal transduction histidine kinase